MGRCLFYDSKRSIREVFLINFTGVDFEAGNDVWKNFGSLTKFSAEKSFVSCFYRRFRESEKLRRENKFSKGGRKFWFKYGFQKQLYAIFSWKVWCWYFINSRLVLTVLFNGIQYVNFEVLQFEVNLQIFLQVFCLLFLLYYLRCDLMKQLIVRAILINGIPFGWHIRFFV